MNVLLTTCLWPRKTFEYLITLDEKKKNNMMNMLFFFTSMYVGILRAHEISSLLNFNLFFSLIISMLLAGLFGLLIYRTIFSLFFWSIGRLFEGRATKNEIRLTLAFSLVPFILLIILGLSIALTAIFLKRPELISFQSPIVLWILWIIRLRILVYGLAFFNKYSYGYALLNSLLPIAIFETIQYAMTNFR